MADFVDYTNATELEKFTFNLSRFMSESHASDSGNISYQLNFRGVDFELSKIRVKEEEILKGIPHFRFNENLLAKCFDLDKFWLLECVEMGRVVSEATGRLLLGALIQNRSELPCFVRIGQVKQSEKYLGFRWRSEAKCDFNFNFNFTEYFETFTENEVKFQYGDQDFNVTSAQIILEWLPQNLRVGYPGFSGYFDSWNPIEKIRVRCVWPQIPREGIKFVREELQTAPILIAEFEESEEKLALRNSTLRSIQAGHLREILFTPMGTSPLISFPSIKEVESAKEIKTIKALYEAMAIIYRKETERLETDFTFKYNFIPKRVLEVMRWERLNETFSLLWRRFLKAIELNWNNLEVIEVDDLVGERESSEIEKSLNLINWCIKRELEWEAALNDHLLLKRLYKIPARHKYLSKRTVDDKIEELGEKLERDLKGVGEVLDSEEFSDCLDEKLSSTTKCERKVLVLEQDYNLNGNIVYEPVVLNCEPPPSKLLTKSLLKNPLAGDVIALNQLKEDMRVFKAWNEEICGVSCSLNSEGLMEFDESGSMDLGFIGFLLWHSPNDIELSGAEVSNLKVSQRMRDKDGQWLKMWTATADESDDTCGLSLNKQVSFNHRGMLAQVISDLTLKTDLSQLLESATPFLTRRATELMNEEAITILDLIEGEAVDGNYPLDRINEELDEYEISKTKSLVLQALCSNVFKDPEVTQVLVAGDEERRFLLSRQHEFKAVKKEIIGTDGGFRELVDNYEGIVIKSSYLLGDNKQ
jgi:hypothetical protein